MSFSNKVVIVTGGSSGIGASTAIAFAKEGADVIIVGRNEARLNNVAEEITKVGNKPLVIKADVSKDDDLRQIVKQTIERYGKIDVLINNAGILRRAGVLDENLPEKYDEVMNNNLRSVVLLTNFAGQHLVKSKGNIVNISSVAGKSASGAVGGNSAYCTSKAGMDHFTRVCAVELAEKGVRVNAVSPGPVETPIIESVGTSDWGPMTARTALKILTQPNEIADLILYLASDNARSITGSDYVIDAGLLLKM